MAETRGRVAIDFETDAERELSKIAKGLEPGVRAARDLERATSSAGKAMDGLGAKAQRAGGAAGRGLGGGVSAGGLGQVAGALGLGGMSPLAMVKQLMDAGMNAVVAANTGPRGGDPAQREAMGAYRSTQRGDARDYLGGTLNYAPVREFIGSLPILGSIVQAWSGEMDRTQREQARGREIDKATHDLVKKRDEILKKAAEDLLKLPDMIARAIEAGNVAGAEALRRTLEEQRSLVEQRESGNAPQEEIAKLVAAALEADERDRQHDEDVLRVLRQMQLAPTQRTMLMQAMGVRDDLRVETLSAITGG